jgi:hypothetical protein
LKNNVQITPFPGNLTETAFTYDQKDHFLFANTTPTTGLAFEEDQLNLSEHPSPFFIDAKGRVLYRKKPREPADLYKRQGVPYEEIYGAALVSDQPHHQKPLHCPGEDSQAQFIVNLSYF